MSINVIVHDTRLPGNTPRSTTGNFSFEVGDSTPIQEFFNRVRAISVESGGIRTLTIMAHGIELMFGGENLGGGYGILFCRELITLQNIDLFALLADKVEHIDLYVCAIAAVSPDVHYVDLIHPEHSTVWSGDGNELCRLMAVRSQASVTAATEIQAYTGSDTDHTLFGYRVYSSGDMDFGEWEGPVITYDRYGNMTRREVFPSAWRTPDGEVHDPRREPRP